MKKINISKPDQYYSQINNKRYPHSACNVTALVECLDITDQLFAHPVNVQPEDHLMEFMRSNQAYNRMESMYPWARKGGYEPNEVHGMLEWAVNILVGKKVDTFSTTWDLRRLLFGVLNGYPSCVSGRFTDFGHIVVLVGFETNQYDIFSVESFEDIKLDQIENIIVDDPYGNYFTEYEDHHGNDTVFSFNKFNDLTKTYNDTSAKWAHFIK